MRFRSTSISLALLLALAAGASGARAGDIVGRLGWLAGCWERTEKGAQSQEQWMEPSGGTMLGMSRTVVADSTVAWEQLRIEQRDSVLVYVARPSGQAETAFTQIELSDSLVVFSAPDHDFPQLIRYRLQSDGSVLAQIEGKRHGAWRVIFFPLSPARCP